MADEFRGKLINVFKKHDTSGREAEKLADDILNTKDITEELPFSGELHITKNTPACINDIVKIDMVEDLQDDMKESLRKKSIIKKQELLKRMHAISVVVNKIPTCHTATSEEEGGGTATKQAEWILDRLLNIYGSEANAKRKLEALETDLKRQATIKKIDEQAGRVTNTDEKSIKEKRDEVLKDKDIDPKNASADEVADATREVVDRERKRPEAAPYDVDTFISQKYDSVISGLVSIIKKGGKKEKSTIEVSPCGMKLDLGVEADGVMVGLDKLAFFGTLDDWVEYYLNGNDDVVGDRFQPIAGEHDGEYIEWPGCMRDLYENTGVITGEELSDLVEEKNSKVVEHVNTDASQHLPESLYMGEGKNKTYFLQGYQK